MADPEAVRTQNPGAAASLRGFARLAAAAVLLVGVTVLAGYALRIPALLTLRTGFRAMSPLTAVSFCFLALSLFAESFRRFRWARVPSAASLALSFMVLALHAIVGADTISQPIAAAVFGFPADSAGRMSPATAIGQGLIALSLLLPGRAARGHFSASDGSAFVALLIAGVALVGYAYGVGDLYAAAPFSTVALHTAFSLLLLSLGALAVDPSRGWAAAVSSDLIGGGATRRQLAVTMLIPITGAVLLRITNAAVIGPSLAMALLVILTTATLWLLILRDGRVQDDLDLERRCRAGILASAKRAVDAELAERITALNQETQDRLTAEDALRQSQKMDAIGQLTGSVAHDFNNLLTVIRGSADLLRKPDLAPERRLRYVSAISDTADKAAKLTKQLLAFSRRQTLQPEVFDAARSVADLAAMLGTLMGERIRIETQVPAEACLVSADPRQLDAALVNIAVNARDAMDGEGRLSLSVATKVGLPDPAGVGPKDTEYVTLAIGDTGRGIPDENLQQIFEPFFTTKGVGHGTGLGLSQVFGFAKQSGGEVHVETRLGEGSTFTMYLPRVRSEATIGKRGETGGPVDGRGTRVLVVEDNAEVRNFATNSLEDLGYTTAWAADAQEALNVLRVEAKEIDVVFSDVVMPGMSGIELAQEIRRLYADLPVVLTSGYSHVLAQNGTYGFELLHKPYSIEQLSRILRKVATWQRRTRTLG